MIGYHEYYRKIVEIDNHLELKIVDKLASLLTEYSISGFKSLKEFNMFVVDRGWLSEFGELYEMQDYATKTFKYSHSNTGMKKRFYDIAVKVLEFPEPEAQFRLMDNSYKN